VNSNKHHPPLWADKLLNYFCRQDFADEILGDLHEAFYWRLKEKGPGKAKTKFAWEVIKSLRPKNLKSFYHFSLNTMILRNYIKIAFRTLLKRKSTSFINIFGLSVGVSAFVLIFLYAYQIISFDDHHEKKDRIFLAYKERITPDGVQPAFDTWAPMKDRFLSDYTQVKAAARIYETDSRIVKNNQYLEEDIMYTDESLFDIFTYPLLYGNEKNIFADKQSVVISVEVAIKYFQKENAIGEVMEIFLPDEDTTLLYQVSAILDRLPANISYRPNMMVQLESIPEYPEIANNWGSSFLETFVLLDQKESAAELEAAFPDLVETLWGAEVRENTNFKLLPYDQSYDQFIGRKADAYTLLLIGFGILLIAAINFMNLSTAQASQRMKEIGLRKVLGAFRGQLRTQFVTEAFVTSLLAILIGIGLVFFITPYFNDFYDVSISFAIFSPLQVVSFCAGLAIALGILSGSYPAIYLSSLRSIDALQQKIGLGGSVNFRNILVVLQFSIALFLITSAILIRNQISFMTQKDMGFNSQSTLAIRASASDFADRDQGVVRLNTYKEQLRNKSYLNEVALSRAIPTRWTRSFTFVRPDGWNGDPLRMRYTYVDAHFFNTYDINLKFGDHFLADSEGGDQRESVILNEAAMKAFEFDPSKQNIIKIGDRRINVVGIVEDFNFESLQIEVAPTLIFHRTAANPVHTYISAQISMSDLPIRLEEMEDMWNELGSTNDFTYYFMSDQVQRLYEAEKRYLGMVTMFSVLAIIVACLGLYGLTLFIIEKRRKEISIRKVLGAEIRGILQLIFRDFTKWVLVSFVISVPFVIFFMTDWLEGYHYRVSISWITFAITLAMVFALVIVTVGYQSLRAASANPVNHLKDE